MTNVNHMNACTGIAVTHVYQHVGCREPCRGKQVGGTKCCAHVIDEIPILEGLPVRNCLILSRQFSSVSRKVQTPEKSCLLPNNSRQAARALQRSVLKAAHVEAGDSVGSKKKKKEFAYAYAYGYDDSEGPDDKDENLGSKESNVDKNGKGDNGDYYEDSDGDGDNNDAESADYYYDDENDGHGVCVCVCVCVMRRTWRCVWMHSKILTRYSRTWIFGGGCISTTCALAISLRILLTLGNPVAVVVIQ